MDFIVYTVIGFFVGAVLAWLIAGKRAQSNLLEAERRASTAEAKTASVEATTTELRRQHEEMLRKTADETQQLRTQLSTESEAKVKAETEKKEIAKRLEEEKQFLAEAGFSGAASRRRSFVGGVG